MTTPSSTQHDELREQAALFALDALTPPERSAFQAHLATCAECRAEVSSLSAVAGALAQTVPQSDPSPSLRARVLASLGSAHGVVRERASRQVAFRSTFVPWMAAAACLVLAVVLGGYAMTLRSRIDRLEARLTETLRRADASERAVADARRAVSDAQSQVAVLASPDLRRIDLAGQPVAPAASARAFWSRSRGLVFTASNLPTPPSGKTYQLWVLTAQPAPISAGLFKPDPNGRVNAVLETPVDLPAPVAMAVTIEPEGGVPAPTGDKYLVGLAPSP